MRSKSCGPCTAKVSFKKRMASSKWEAFRRSICSLMTLLRATLQAEHDQDREQAPDGERHAANTAQARHGHRVRGLKCHGLFSLQFGIVRWGSVAPPPRR